MKNGERIPFDVKVIEFPGPSLTWAGECPWVNGSEKGFAFGTEDGSIWFSSLSGPPKNSTVQQIIPSGEAINGLVFNGKRMAASTRVDLIIREFDEVGGPERIHWLYEGGAHGVAATARGGFVAPLGPMGLLLFEPNPSDRNPLREIRAEGRDLYYYKVVSLGLTEQASEIFACAGRADGIMVLEIGPNGHTDRILTSFAQSRKDETPFDVIDVCSLKTLDFPRATAILSIDGSLELSRDILQAFGQVSLHLPELKGTPYSVHAAQGHIFIHTSEALYAMPNLVTLFLEGQNLAGRSMVRRYPCEAIDCTIAYGEHLLLNLGKTVYVISISEWMADSTTSARKNEGLEILSETRDSLWDTSPLSVLELAVL